jgi:hypothetical protein
LSTSETGTRDFSHVVVTRLGLGISSDAWFRQRFPIFKNMCFPSLAGQTRACDRWIVSCDIKAPAWLDDEFAILSEQMPALELRRIDPFVIGNLNPLNKNYLKSVVSHDHVLTSRIDDDDCWRRDYVQRLQDVVVGMRARGFGKIGVTLYQGWEYSVAEDMLQDMPYPWHSMSVNVLSPMADLVTGYDFGHTRSAARLREEGYSLLEYADGCKYWLYLRHAGADSAYKGLKATGSRIPITDKLRQEAAKSFNVDLGRVAALFADGDIALPGIDAEHPLVKAILKERKNGIATQLEIKQDLLKTERALRREDKIGEADAVRKLFYAE